MSEVSSYNFVLDKASSQKLDEIAAHFSREFGVRNLSRSEAVRQLINRFVVSSRSVERPVTVEATK